MKRPALRQSARGRECTLRLPECNNDPSTTVLCHAVTKGMAMKCSDLTAFFGCSACHAAYDGRRYPREWLAVQALRAIGETHRIWEREGLL